MKLLVCLMLVISVNSLRYVPDDPANKALVDQYRPMNASGVMPADNGKVFVIAAQLDATLGWSQTLCSDKAGLKTALEMDATTAINSAFTNEDKYGHGPCCLNQHHYVCQILISEINKCAELVSHLSKYNTSEPSSCPQ
jgi:hypothetical protein